MFARLTAGQIFVTIACICVIAFTAGCSRNKPLTADSAKPMIQNAIDGENGGNLLANYYSLAGLTDKETSVDFTQGQYRPGTVGSVFNNLLIAGLVMQTVRHHSYPNLRGTYESDEELEFHPISLFMQPGSLTVSGNFRYVSSKNQGGKDVSCTGDINGKINENGTLSLNFGYPREGSMWCSASFASGTYSIAKSNDSVVLTNTHPAERYFTPPVFHGKSSAPDISIPSYSYSFTSKFREAIANPGNSIRVGKINVESVTNLLLGGSDTQAQGQFKWHARLNDVGRVLMGVLEKSGVGHAVFGKQPDGTWVCVGVSLS